MTTDELGFEVEEEDVLDNEDLWEQYVSHINGLREIYDDAMRRMALLAKVEGDLTQINREAAKLLRLIRRINEISQTGL